MLGLQEAFRAQITSNLGEIKWQHVVQTALNIMKLRVVYGCILFGVIRPRNESKQQNPFLSAATLRQTKSSNRQGTQLNSKSSGKKSVARNLRREWFANYPTWMHELALWSPTNAMIYLVNSQLGHAKSATNRKSLLTSEDRQASAVSGQKSETEQSVARTITMNTQIRAGESEGNTREMKLGEGKRGERRIPKEDETEEADEQKVEREWGGLTDTDRVAGRRISDNGARERGRAREREREARDSVDSVSWRAGAATLGLLRTATVSVGGNDIAKGITRRQQKKIDEMQLHAPPIQSVPGYGCGEAVEVKKRQRDSKRLSTHHAPTNTALRHLRTIYTSLSGFEQSLRAPRGFKRFICMHRASFGSPNSVSKYLHLLAGRVWENRVFWRWIDKEGVRPDCRTGTWVVGLRRQAEKKNWGPLIFWSQQGQKWAKPSHAAPELHLHAEK
ncbi:hypothetical protein C8R47DRAFT_1077111 [Mycena vitilis]|nr:hypothetical protein C8R47DRAFT_1077111 [Mycena vitilis]